MNGFVAESARGKGSFAITPTDTDATVFARTAIGVYVGTTGNVEICDPEGNETVWANVPAGFIIPCECVRVGNSLTTASDLVGVY